MVDRPTVEDGEQQASGITPTSEASSRDSLQRGPVPADEAVQERGDHMPKSILVVEDSATQRELLRADLEAVGYAVSVAADGEQALALLDAGRFDLILSDVVMPGMSGYDLCREAKRRDLTLPVVLLTSLSDPLDVVHGLQAGADNFLRKPYAADQLLDRIQTILYNRQLRQSGQAQMGLELFFLKQRFMITAERQQILDLLVSTFEDLIETNQQLREREEELAGAHEQLTRQLAATEAERQQLNGVMAALPQIMYTVDRDGMITGASDGALDFLGAARTEDILGRPLFDLVPLLSADGAVLPVEQRPIHRALVGGECTELGGAFDLLAQRAGGPPLPVVARSAPLHDGAGRTTGAVGLLHEVGLLASHDPLTGLPTQASFAVQVQSAVDRNAEGCCAAVLVLAPDRFQRIRDSLGHTGSNAVVAGLARRLKDCLTSANVSVFCPTASAAYLGNQEFAVVLSDLEDDTDAVRTAEVLVEELCGDYRAEGVDVPLTLSIGVAVTASAAAKATDLVPAAASAARAAADAGGNRAAVSDAETSRRAAERLREESELRRGIEEGQLRLLYQPQISLSTGEVAGVEALVRWEHPERGLQPPSAFLPLAEDGGLMVPLGTWVLREACRQVAAWRRDVPVAAHWSLSVNLAPEQLVDDHAAEVTRQALADSGLEPTALQVEITETGVMADPAAAGIQLAAIKALGARVAMDDFGTGNSSLVQLRRFPIDVLKVDRMFVAGMTTDDEDAAIVAATVRLGQALGLEVVAEGVETIDQLLRLRVLGCDLGQGFHWAQPLTADELLAWAERRPDDDRERALTGPPRPGMDVGPTG